MATPDSLYLALIAIGLLLDHFVLWSTFRRRAQADPGRARVWIWSAWMCMLWVLVAAGAALWSSEARAWGLLRLVAPHGWRLLIAIGLVLALAILQARTVAKVARVSPSRRVRLQSQFGDLGVVLPHTRSELGWFTALSLSAGFCEEFIFRGYLIWSLQPLLGLWGAAGVSVAVFAVAHAYQGAAGILKTGIVGAALTLVVLILGSLLPAMVLHATVDIGSGLIAWLVLREERAVGLAT